MGSSITVDTSKIPERKRMDLLYSIHHAVERYFSEPGVEEEFQKWKAERDQKKGVIV